MIVLFLFVLGTCIGSFVNVLIDRIPNGKSVIRGRSSCDFCHHELSWYDLVPVFSFLILSGRCRYCHKKLSLQYPLVELTIGLSFIGIFLLQHPTTLHDYLLLIAYCLLLATGFALAVMDIKYRMLSDFLLIFFSIFSLLFLYVGQPLSILPHLLIGFATMLPFFLVFFVSQGKALGFGDVKLSFCLGLLLGFPLIGISLYIAFLSGAAIGIVILILKRKKLHGQTIAFGPFLLFGTLVAAIWGNGLWKLFLIWIGLG